MPEPGLEASHDRFRSDRRGDAFKVWVQIRTKDCFVTVVPGYSINSLDTSVVHIKKPPQSNTDHDNNEFSEKAY